MTAERTALRATAGGRDFVFCSDHCRSSFLANPAHFVPALAAVGGGKA